MYLHVFEYQKIVLDRTSSLVWLSTCIRKSKDCLAPYSVLSVVIYSNTKNLSVVIYSNTKGLSVVIYSNTKGLSVVIYSNIKGISVVIYSNLKGFSVVIFSNSNRIVGPFLRPKCGYLFEPQMPQCGYLFEHQ